MRRPGRMFAFAVLCVGSTGVLSTIAPASGTAARGAYGSGRRLKAHLPHRFKIHGTGLVGSSYNWSGYAQSAPNGTFTAISGTFTVPTVDTAAAGVQYSSEWLGIGGDNDQTLIQAGVEADNLSGVAIYDAWTEMLPAGENVLSGLVVKPGDTINVTIDETARNKWKITVADDTTGNQAVRKVRYKSSGGSAEAIVERPCISLPCSAVTDLANLAQTSTETFDPVLAATSPPSNSPSFQPLLSPIAGASLNEILMVDNSGLDVIAYPSNANSSNNGFSVADGSTAPSPPS